MKKFVSILALVLVVLTSCTHKDLCMNHREHAHRYHINVIADYRLDWEECYGSTDWKINWPENYIDYESLRPKQPKGLRIVNYNEEGNYNIHNIPATGGVVTLYEGRNNMLFYNNDTEYIVFSRYDNGASTRATTRTCTRATYTGNKYANEGEPTVNAPDMLFANYRESYVPEKVLEPIDYPITLQPLVFTYKIRYEFAEGLKYVALARGALSGMAQSVQMNTGETSEDTATILYDCDMTEYGARALVNSFGAPGYPNANYPTRANKHALNLEVMLRNGNMVTFEYDVSNQVAAQPHGGVIVIKGIVIKEEDGVQGSGAFDVEVKDWGEYEDIVLPLM